ncbi:MAG: glutamine synthetase family protein [Clostridiales bacterium]|jgi:glutamine synthetase|nr:glutamine synthetase family protein [Clostridiales bacterium]
MTSTVREILEFVKENDVKFVRLAFCDVKGGQKNIAVTAGNLEKAFTVGTAVNAAALTGFSGLNSDVVLLPDPSTLNVLPWRPDQGRVARFYCDLGLYGQKEFYGNMRGYLRRAAERGKAMGVEVLIGTEIEFYLFKTDERGLPASEPYDACGYLDVAPLDKGENIRRDICLTLETMGIIPESSHHEKGPGQNEIKFRHSDILTAADNYFTYKSVVKAVAARNGVFASFMPKPLKSRAGNGLHLRFTLKKNGKNLFCGNSRESEAFAAGVLERIAEVTPFLNSTVNSYERLGENGAPKHVSWSAQNRSQLIRLDASESGYMELRSPDPALNPYLAFALLVHAGLDGIESGLSLPPPCDKNLNAAPPASVKNYRKLPDSFASAVKAALESEFVKSYDGGGLLTGFLDTASDEIASFADAADSDEWIRQNYFIKL